MNSSYLSFNTRRIIIALMVLFVLIPSFSCAIDRNPKGPMVELQVGAVTFKTELARSEDQQRMGLMFRTAIQDDEAMIFIYDKAEYRSFWMKNTQIYLSIAYIDADGVILEILHMKPGDLTPIKSSQKAQYALEVAQGAFARRGIKVGDRVNVSQLR